MAIDFATDLEWRRVPVYDGVITAIGGFEAGVHQVEDQYRWWVSRTADLAPFDSPWSTPDVPYAAEGGAASFDEGLRRVAASLDELGVIPRPRVDWRVLVGPDNAVIAPLGAYQVTVEEMAGFGPDKVEWRIARSGETVGVSAPEFTNAVFDPVAEGRSTSMGAGMAAAEDAATMLVVGAVMTPEDANTFLAAFPELADRVEARGRQLADQFSVLPHALGARPDTPAARGDYDAEATARRAAEVALLARQPAPVLAQEWRELSGELAVSPALSQRDNAAISLGVERQRVRDQTTNLARVEDRLDSLEQAPRRRRNSQGIELARREAMQAAQSLATAQASLAAAQDRLDAAELGVAAQAPARSRRDVLDEALDAKTAAAVATPAPYLATALGPRPEAGDGALRWDAGATRIESYRHRQLGLEPDDGPVLDADDITAAIGESPGDYVEAMQWRTAALAVDEVAMVEPPVAELGIEL